MAKRISILFWQRMTLFPPVTESNNRVTGCFFTVTVLQAYNGTVKNTGAEIRR